MQETSGSVLLMSRLKKSAWSASRAVMGMSLKVRSKLLKKSLKPESEAPEEEARSKNSAVGCRPGGGGGGSLP